MTIHLRRGDTAVAIATAGGMPEIAYYGRAIDRFEPAALGLPVPRATLDVAPPMGIVAESGRGFTGRPGLVGSRPDGTDHAPVFATGAEPVVAEDGGAVTFQLTDSVAALDLALDLALTEAGTLTIAATLANRGETTYGLQRLAPSVPVPAAGTELLTFTGRWCHEFQTQRSGFDGLNVIENRRGRTSHDRLPAVFAGTAGFSEQRGEVWGLQLAWSGNFEIAMERTSEGRRHLQAGELLAPGELVLGPGESYRSPEVVATWSADGLTAASQGFHRHLRLRDALAGPRKVVLNTWEAVYFDHDLDTLRALADVAAAVGVERFVLDDGWFSSRRDDMSGLGDWWVSEDVWPDGLSPIVDHVVAAGMEFGLWVEPEMVNPDSELYRKHPEWALTTDGYEPVLGRNQLVLDCGRPEVTDYLFGQIDDLLTRNDIAYLKWDMNRDLVQASRHGRPATHGHVVGLYRLLDRIRAANPGIEIESCASGGGRADLGILSRTERIWTSDCNDAGDRQAIQRGFSMLFPPEVMGAHIGPERSHTTHRRQRLGFRAATALFGHFGIEWNLLDATESERAEVAAAVGLYKRLRPLLHGGSVVRVDHPDPAAIVHGVVADDRRSAIFAYVQLTPSVTTVPSPMVFPGLDPDLDYRVAVVDDIDAADEAGRERPPWLDRDGPIVLGGAQLLRSGLQPPVLHPESVLLLELSASH